MRKKQSGYELFRLDLKNDEILLGWHNQIVCWIIENFGIVDYEKRNEFAQKFIKRFFDINYDWIKLVNPTGRTFSVDDVMERIREMKFCNGCRTQLVNDDCPNKMCPYKTRFIEKLYNREFGKDIEEVYDGDNENFKKHEKK